MDCSMPGFPLLHYLWVFPSSCPLNQWCHQNISSSVTLFSFCLQSFPTSESFPMSQLFSSGRTWKIGAPSEPKDWSFSFSFGISPSNEYSGWFPLGLTGLISLQSKGLSRVFFTTAVQKHQFFSAQPSLYYSSHIQTWLLEKPYLKLYGPFVVK